MNAHSFLSGRLDHVRFPDLLLEISQRRETGIFHVTRQNIEKEIYFQDGRIVFAKSNDPDQRLGELLLRRGKISLRQLEDSAAKIVPGVRLGTILVQDGYLKAGELYQGVIDQVEEIVYSVFEWSEGDYSFQSGDLPSKEVITLSISTPDIINMGIARIWRWSWISKGVGPLDTVFLRRREWSAISKKMLITPAMHSLIEMLEQPMNLEDVLHASRINSYETCKLLWTLLSIGLIERIPRLELPPELVAEETQPAPPAVPEPPIEAPTEQPETEIISWQPRRLPPLPPQPETVEVMVAPEPPPETPAIPSPELSMLQSLEPGAAPTVEISFSDLAEFTDQAAEASVTPAPVAENSSESEEKKIRKDIADFNELHRYLFEMLRIEIGTGVGNFLTKILKRAMEKSPLIFEGIQMNEYGELDAEALKASIQGNMIDDYSEAFDWLLNEERTRAASFLDKKRVEGIEAGLQKLQEKHREAN